MIEECLNPYEKYKPAYLDEYYCASALLNSLKTYLETYRPKNENTISSIVKLLFATDFYINQHPDMYAKSKLDIIFDEVTVRDTSSTAIKLYRVFLSYPLELKQKVVGTILSYLFEEKVKQPKF